MRVMLALAVGFCLAFPLVAEAAKRYPSCPPRLPPLARQVCLCELSGGDPHIFYFPPPPHVMCFARGFHP